MDVRVRRRPGLRRAEWPRDTKLMALFSKIGPNFTINPAPTTATAGASTKFGTTNPSDPFPAGAVTKYTWSWGDGTPNTVTSGSTSSVTHTFTVGGGVVRTVTVTAQDGYGVTTAQTLQVTVN
jgi:PKD domain